MGRSAAGNGSTPCPGRRAGALRTRFKSRKAVIKRGQEPPPLSAPPARTGTVREVHLGKQFTLSASDSFKLGAYRADPAGTPKGGIVVIQEIFGVNQHIRKVCDDFAKEGYAAVAPALFDRTQKDFQSGYTPPEIEKARTFVAKPDWDAMMRDTDAAVKELSSAGPVGIIGFCMGGTIAFLGATRLSGLSAAVGYYGGSLRRFCAQWTQERAELHLQCE